VLTVATDPNSSAIKGVQALIGRFPLASLGVGALKSKLQQSGVNYDGDVRPLFGNPIAFGLTLPQLSSRITTDALVVWMSKDSSKLKALVKKAVPGIKTIGSHDGATLYAAGAGGSLAIDGATAIIGSSRTIVTAALDRHSHGGGVTAGEYSRALAGLPQDAVVKSFGDLTGILSRPSAAKARRVPWVAALRGFAETVTASSSGLTFNYHFDTAGAPLTPSQLPFAQGTTAPNFAGPLPITLGIHDPAQIVSFIETTEQTTNPAGYARALSGQAALRRKTGVDLNSLVNLMTGDLIVASDTVTTLARAKVTDPAAAQQTLDKLAGERVTVFAGAPLVRVGPGYELESGSSRILLRVVGDQLVLARGPVSNRAALGRWPDALQAFATAPTSPAPAAHGAVAFRVSLNQLLALVLRQAPPRALQSVLSQLTDITGSSSVSPSGLTGSATIGVK
jgi:hypothetical protein